MVIAMRNSIENFIIENNIEDENISKIIVKRSEIKQIRKLENFDLPEKVKTKVKK